MKFVNDPRMHYVMQNQSKPRRTYQYMLYTIVLLVTRLLTSVSQMLKLVGIVVQKILLKRMSRILCKVHITPKENILYIAYTMSTYTHN